MQCLLQLLAHCLPDLTEDALAELVALRSKRPKDSLPPGVSREVLLDILDKNEATEFKVPELHMCTKT
eukprot:2315786-Lingulodinium_polyedra.AAC.1